MAEVEDELRDLREKNSELAQEVQFWKMTAGQKEKEKLELMKEINELRLKLSRIRSGGAAEARKLDAALQSASEEALSHLVQASGAVARTIELAKQYMQDRQELENISPRWSRLGGTPTGDRVHKVSPLLLGGQSIQPVVLLNRTMLNNRSITRSPNQSRALPMHMLQDLYIPLTRINAEDLQTNNLSAEDNNNVDNSTEDMGLEENNEQDTEESQNLTSLDEMEESRRLDAVIEDLEPEDVQSPVRLSVDNPLEGPSWLLDISSTMTQSRVDTRRAVLEPDSTTPSVEPHARTTDDNEKENEPLRPALVFSPTVRRRKRVSSPPRASFSPRPRHSGRVLKVLVAKMRLPESDPGGSGDSSPPKRAAQMSSPPASPRQPDSSPRRKSEARDIKSPQFDAPSPNGATDARVIVSEALNVNQGEPLELSHLQTTLKGSRAGSRAHSCSRDYSDSDNSDLGELRTRRPRKQVSYKEKPLNRKLRR